MSILKRALSADQIRWYALENKIFERKIKEVFKLLRTSDIEPILIKGWSAARFYPAEQPRPYSDIDICVEPELFGKAEKILSSFAEVDLHRGFRHLDLLTWGELFDNSELIETGDTQIRVLACEDHLRILCVHWLLDGGAFRDKLSDVYYMLENRSVNFDWERFLNSGGKVRRFWLVCVIGLTHLELGLKIDDTPVAEEACDLPGWFVRAVEREWRSEVRLVPLVNSFGNFKLLSRQIGKRFRINPVLASVMEEGDFRDNFRLKYQIKNFFNRLKEFVKKSNS